LTKHYYFFNNKFSHLTNACITKIENKTEEIFSNNMMDKNSFKNYLNDIDKKHHFDSINKMMEEQIINSLKSAQDSVSSRKSSFSVFGFDFMIDSRFRVWLIEINASPSMEMSSPVTEKLVKEFQRDIVRWLIDYDVFEKRLEGVYIGNLRLLYKDNKSTALTKIQKKYKKQL